ncbi:MerR family transcriptional regulator [Plantactinospora sp. KBS50]|uniref:MerR family transcriptional regulator n=1 Tax=Plantactinospora sp. KBS50 TaxID=2024580 RepID=UPI000BAB15DF|nr:MerR family transcriptional regulator [Plantactinospora sp. KBS50]ASW56195.1 MerR family transcriptional regulator [Plantactinospora sp. KBS50]
MRPGLTIGEFAILTHLSVRTLRRHDEAGLLAPARVDPHTGYRYYAADQIPTAQVIHRLRELDVPLADIRAVLATDDPGERGELISEHLDRVEESLSRTRSTVRSLRRLLGADGRDPRIDLRAVPARTVAGITDEVDRSASLSWYAGAMAELDAAFAASERTGPAGGRYANELFTRGRGAMTVHLPVRAPRATGRIAVISLPAVELAVAVHHGPHDDIDVTYGRLGAWVAGHALAVDGPIHETYLVGPRDTGEAEAWRTEIGWPVFRLTDGRAPAGG